MGVGAELLTAHIAYSQEEIAWARWRPAAYRTPLPAVGQRVMYRAEHWAAPVYATVLEVEFGAPAGPVREWPNPYAPPYDVHCWRVKTDMATATPLRNPDGSMVVEPHPDTWPTLLLAIDGRRSHEQTREARLRGSAGWLPLDWATRCRPLPSQELPR